MHLQAAAGYDGSRLHPPRFRALARASLRKQYFHSLHFLLAINTSTVYTTVLNSVKPRRPRFATLEAEAMSLLGKEFGSDGEGRA